MWLILACSPGPAQLDDRGLLERGPAEAPVTDPGAQGQPCDVGRCDEGLVCVTFAAVGGPAGPETTSCEIPCPEGAPPCPAEQRCQVLPDRGPVCR